MRNSRPTMRILKVFYFVIEETSAMIEEELELQIGNLEKKNKDIGIINHRLESEQVSLLVE